MEVVSHAVSVVCVCVCVCVRSCLKAFVWRNKMSDAVGMEQSTKWILIWASHTALHGLLILLFQFNLIAKIRCEAKKPNRHDRHHNTIDSECSIACILRAPYIILTKEAVIRDQVLAHLGLSHLKVAFQSYKFDPKMPIGERNISLVLGRPKRIYMGTVNPDLDRRVPMLNCLNLRLVNRMDCLLLQLHGALYLESP